MAKWVVPAAEIAVGVALEFTPFAPVGTALIMTGASQEVGNLISALSAKTGDAFSEVLTAQNRQIVYGTMRVDGAMVYESTSGHQLNRVIVWAAHPCQSIDAIYLDGRLVHLTMLDSNGGKGDGGTYYDDSGNEYSFGDELAIFSTPGSAAGYWFHELYGNDGKWTSDCTANNLCASYIKTTYTTKVWNGPPNARATLHGKCDIWDPRLGDQFLIDGVTPNPASHAWTDNAALIIADLLCNAEFGVGCSYNPEIDIPTLIAAANICDELVPLANGLSEKRYTINCRFDTSRAPGEILQDMLDACEGRISYSGGTWKIFPAAWYGPTLAFGADDLAGGVKWTTKRKYRELVNAVRATYVCPQYPYAVVGYNRDNKDSSIFAGEWRPTDMPEYAQDTNHGYSGDANLAADGNNKLYADRKYEFVTSCATAQRLAKIFMLRNRQQGTGTLPMKLSAFQSQACDVIEMNFSPLGWTNKYLEIANFRFMSKSSSGENGEEVPTLQCELDVMETDPSVYDWDVAEERTIQNTTSPAIGRDWMVDDPTGLALLSNTNTALLGADGVAQPRIFASWTEPTDPFVISGGHIEVQYQVYGASSWLPVGKFDGIVNNCYVAGVVSGVQYNVQIRSVRANGATGNWVEAGPCIASVVNSNIFGMQLLANPDFEFNTVGVAVNTPLVLGGWCCDSWSVEYLSSPFLIELEQDGSAYSGSNNVLIQLPAVAFSTAATAGVWSDQTVVIPGQTLTVGGRMKWVGTLSSGAAAHQFIRVWFLDATLTIFSYVDVASISVHNNAWVAFSGTVFVPAGAVYMRVACLVNIDTGGGASAGVNNFMFDTMNCVVGAGSSSALNGLPAVVPNQPITINYTATTTSIALTWAQQSILRSDGTTVTLQSGSLTYTGLSASTSYFIYPYIRMSDMTLQFSNPNPPQTSSSDSYAMQAALDGRSPCKMMMVTTPSSGSNGGTGGGGGLGCPDGAELVDVEGRGSVKSIDVQLGERIRGRSQKTNQDVYRRITGKRTHPCSAWYLINGYRNSPCEPVWSDGGWRPAFQVTGAKFDSSAGVKVDLTVEADEYNEANFYLVGRGEDLLIHNFLIVGS